MKQQEILEKLCYYDSRNPDYDQENGEKPKDCFCDNCFYGRDKLANELLKANELFWKILHQHDISIGGVQKDLSQELINEIKQATE